MHSLQMLFESTNERDLVMCPRGGQCARVVGDVRAVLGMRARCEECARGERNVRAGWRMCARGGECARGVENVRA